MPKLSDRWVRITLADSAARAHHVELDFRVYESPTARRWSELVAYLDARGAHIVTPERFYNFAGDPKNDPSWVRTELQACIDGVRRWEPTLADWRLDTALDQKALNDLHERFVDASDQLQNQSARDALMAGDTLGSVGRCVKDRALWAAFLEAFESYAGRDALSLDLFGILTALDGHPQFGHLLRSMYGVFNPTHALLERMNQAIHRWEDWARASEREAKGIGDNQYFVVNYFPCMPMSVDDADMAGFTVQDTFGRVYLDQVVAGKCIWDVFRDRDEQIVGKHYTNLDRFWGDARFYFGADHGAELVNAQLDEFWRWFEAREGFLEQVGFRRNDPRMAVGNLPVADLDLRGELRGLGRAEVVALVSRHRYITRARLVDEAGASCAPSMFSRTWAEWVAEATSGAPA